MIQLGRLDEAEPLIELFEGNGRRLDRAWMSAAGGRCRAMLLAARGEVKAATRAVERALAEHDRVRNAPFERARAQIPVSGSCNVGCGIRTLQRQPCWTCDQHL